jgi:hypothetical protein
VSIFDRFVPSSRLVARLVADRGLHGAEQQFAHGRLVAPGLRLTAVMVHRGAVSGPVDPADHGGWDACAQAGIQALRRFKAPLRESLTVAGSRVETFIADDVFGASRLLVLDELMAQVLHVERPSHGTLVIAPNRHLLGIHVLESVDAVPAALTLLGELALAQHRVTGPVSPWVYYRSPDGTLSLLSSSTSSQGLHPRFDQALRSLAQKRS